MIDPAGGDTDETANASYNEVRIFEGALSPADLETLHDLGPDAVF